MATIAKMIADAVDSRFKPIEAKLMELLGDNGDEPQEADNVINVRGRIKRATNARVADEPVKRKRANTGTRFATKAYEVIRTRSGKPTGEPKRPADQAVWKFLLRHKSPQTILDCEKATGLSNSVLRNNLYRLTKEGRIKPVVLAD